MKKLLMLSVVGFITLNSFNVKPAKSTVKLYRVYYHCTDGSGGGSFLTNDLSAAQSIANFLCS